MSEPTSAPAPAQKLVPYVPSEVAPREFTLRAVILGVLMAFIFNAANAYVGLKIGLTVSASIPSAVISMALLRKFLPSIQRMFGAKDPQPGTVLENNTAHAVASTGEALAAGIIFTLPSFYFLTAREVEGGYEGGHLLGEWETFAFGTIGGLLGILAFIPLRQYLMVREHGRLPFPEGVACAKVLIAGDRGGVSAQPVFLGIATGLVGKGLMSMVGLWKEVVMKSWESLHKATLGFEGAPLLLGVGYLIGPRIAAVMLAGSMLGFVVLIPMFDWLAHNLCVAGPDVAERTAAIAASVYCQPVPPSTTPLIEMSADAMRGSYIKYIGAGGVAFGGAWSILRTLPQIATSLKATTAALKHAREGRVKIPRTEVDMPLWVVGVAIAVLFIGILVLPTMTGSWTFAITILMALLAVGFAFFFVAVSAQTVGLVGSTSQPVSGMTITAVLASSLLISALGFTGMDGKFAAMTIGAIVCISICLSGDMAQDLKTGALLGATPKYIQYGQMIGVTWAALRAGAILGLLHAAYKLGSPMLAAPQANLMASLVNGAMGGELQWTLLGLGAAIGLVCELCGLSALAFSIGLYLPISTWPPIFVGGLIAWLVARKKGTAAQKDHWSERGTLFASGLVAGDALMGIAISILAVIADRMTPDGGDPPYTVPFLHFAESYGEFNDLVPLVAFAVFAAILVKVAWGGQPQRGVSPQGPYRSGTEGGPDDAPPAWDGVDVPAADAPVERETKRTRRKRRR